VNPFLRRAGVPIAVALAISSCEFFSSPTEPSQTSLLPTAVSGGLTFVKLAAGEGHTCGLTTGGATYCWGYNGTQSLVTGISVPTGQLGDSSTIDRAAPVKVSGGKTFISITAGAFHTCGLTSAGAAWCWGANKNEVQSTATNPYPTGQLGDGTAVNQSSPVAVSGGLTFGSISAGYFHTCGLTLAGAAYCWGSGGLGVGDSVTRLTPTAVAGGLSFQSLSAGGTHTCGLIAGGVAYCWGNDLFGQLGDSATTGQLQPVAVKGGKVWQSIVAGGNVTCGVVAGAGGATYCWGDNLRGAVGDGGILLAPNVPTKVVTTDTLSELTIGSIAASISFGSMHVCGLNKAGLARCWGNNNAAQVGDGSTALRAVPTAVTTALAFTSLAAGGLHTCGLVASGAAYCWGARYVVGAAATP
jgi:alpha-tubulin suppressor-like RCC1 family protein